MGTEIERKFLLRSDGWRTGADGVAYRQGYLSTTPGRTVRVRLAGEEGFLTIKGETHGSSRAEFEYSIPALDARTLLDELCERPLIEKTRYLVEHEGHTWEIDEFGGDNRGLVVAEVELGREDEQVALPEWLGEEVTHDLRYQNSNLVAHPYTRW